MGANRRGYLGAAIYPDTHRAARFIVAITRETIAGLFERLIAEELQRVKGREREIIEPQTSGVDWIQDAERQIANAGRIVARARQIGEGERESHANAE